MLLNYPMGTLQAPYFHSKFSISIRTFDYRNVASLMCECTPICLEVATLYGSGLYNMQGPDYR